MLSRNATTRSSVSRTLLLLSLVGLLAAVTPAFARGGKGKGKGKGKGGRNAQPTKSRDEVLKDMQDEMSRSDRMARFEDGRREDSRSVRGDRRDDMLKRHRRSSEDTRRADDARTEAPR